MTTRPPRPARAASPAPSGRPAHRPNSPRPDAGQGVLPAPDNKAVFVQEMFDRIARHYDLMNHLMTLGCDRLSRRITVAQVASAFPPAARPPGAGLSAAPTPRLLDVATGTGDLALEALHQVAGSQVIGVDFSAPMLALAQRKGLAGKRTRVGSVEGRLGLAVGDALRLPFPDSSFDAVVTGFALRNVVSIPQAFAEMARVVRSGGRLACLEIARPHLLLFRSLFAFYFYHLVPLLGRWLVGEGAAYTYLPHSLTAFLTPDEIVAVIGQTGWRDVGYRRVMLGTAAVHTAVRE